MLKPLFKKAPYWYQQGKELLQQDYKDPARLGTNYDGVVNRPTSGLDFLQTGVMTLTAPSSEDSPAAVIAPTVQKVSVTATPGSGGSATVFFTTDSAAKVLEGSAAWTAWASGSVTAATTVVYERAFSAVYIAAVDADAVVRVEVIA